MQFDFDYSPDSYFENLTFDQKIDSNIKGEVRRIIASKKIKTEAYPPELVGRSFNQYSREGQGKQHPDLMGGEYLPNMVSNEAEICRIVLKSSTMDVISLRVSIGNGMLNYWVSDENKDDPVFKYVLKHKASQQPLSMGLMIENIDTCLLNEVYEG